jgi:hypothetical protein
MKIPYYSKELNIFPVYRSQYVIFGEWVDASWRCPFDTVELQGSCFGYSSKKRGEHCIHCIKNNEAADICRCYWLHQSMLDQGLVVRQ